MHWSSRVEPASALNASDKLVCCVHRITIWIGAVLAAIGYSGLWLAATGKLVVGYTGVLVLAFIAGNASSYYDTATIVTNVSFSAGLTFAAKPAVSWQLTC